MSLRLSTAPHIRSPKTTTRLMLNVLLALLPSAAAGVWYFGTRALMLLCVSTASAVVAEYLWQKLGRLPVRVGDLSAAVTGLILGLILPPTATWWMAVVGSVFAIIIVKQLFGGIGDNFLNPAMAARAVLLASWPARMTAYVTASRFGVDAVSTATPLARRRGGLIFLSGAASGKCAGHDRRNLQARDSGGIASSASDPNGYVAHSGDHAGLHGVLLVDFRV